MFVKSARRPLVVAAVVAVVAILLTACGGVSEPASAPAPEPTMPPTATAVAPPTEPPATAAPTPTPAAAATEPPVMAAAVSEPAPAAGESCAPSADLTFDDQRPKGGTLVRLFSDPTSLDPHQIGDVTSSIVVGEIFGGLVTLSLDYQPVLDLAESCIVSADGTVYTFVLRENAQFHDGKPVTAHDVKWSIERAADPDTLSTNAQNYLGDIIGVNEKLEGAADAVSGVRVVDDRTIEFTIDAPKSFFLAKLSYPTAYVLDPEQVDDKEIGRAHV